MKIKLFMMLTIISILICLPACSSATPLEVDCDTFRENNHLTNRVEVSNGETFTVTLCSNPTTGFKWQETAEIADQSVLQQTGHEFIAPGSSDGKRPMPGSAGVEVWTFKALKTGNTTVYMEYGRPWEGGEKAVWTYKLTVVVK